MVSVNTTPAPLVKKVRITRSSSELMKRVDVHSSVPTSAETSRSKRVCHVLTFQGFVKEASEVEDPKESLLMVDKRVFGGKHFDDMKAEGEAEVTEDD